MSSNENIEDNFETICSLVEDAAGRGAHFVIIPENALYIGPQKGNGAVIRGAKVSTWVQGLSDLAAQFGIYLLVGSVREKIANSKKVYNTSLLYSPTGNLLATYRKIHLFDIHIPGRVSERESAIFKAGRDTVVTEVDDFNVGLTICYDLRFPELYRKLSLLGADVLCVPSNFTLMTGKDHWRPLLVARAIENQSFVIAPAQFGAHHGGRRSYGHSMIIDPRGTVLAEAPEDWTGVITADIELETLEQVRTNLPSMHHRRNDLFKL